MSDRLRGKVAIVTGAAHGIGRAIAERYGGEGASVVVCDINAAGAEEVAAGIRDAGGTAVAVATDVSDKAAVDRLFDETEQRFGAVDVIVNSAGLTNTERHFLEGDEAWWDRIHAVNLKGTFLTVKHALPLLKRQGGAVVIISSVNGTRMFSNTGASAYACSKAGQVAFSRMAALELAQDRIRVNTVCPGAIDTRIDENTRHRDLESIREPVEFPEGQIPLTDGKPGSSRQVAELIWFLVSDLSAHITGAEVFIDGGQSLLQG